jgi:hypothetical protein
MPDKHTKPFLHLAVLLLLAVLAAGQVLAQNDFKKPGRRSSNLLNAEGPYLKTIFSFEPASYDTLTVRGQGPVPIARYNEKEIIPIVFDAVFESQVRVYNPNFWGSIPRLKGKSGYETFDTLKILEYLSAGWDTSYLINNDGSMEPFPEYREISYHEIAGLFFFEHWWLDRKTSRLSKDVIAYLPIREYVHTPYEGYDNVEIGRRLLFMVIPEWSSGSKKTPKIRSRDYKLARKDLVYEVKLYNKPYEHYLYREEGIGNVNAEEYNSWQYHAFDFYRFFDANLFLENIINQVLDGKLSAYFPGTSTPIDRDSFSRMLSNPPGMTIEWDEIKTGNSRTANTLRVPIPDERLEAEDFPVAEMNSLVFREDWYINPDNLHMYKDVREMTVTRTESRFDDYTGNLVSENSQAFFTVRF